jgi:hypothetical protein
MNCPTCNVEFDSPYIREAWRKGKPVWCPQGHRLEFVPPLAARPVEEQVEALERMFVME